MNEELKNKLTERFDKITAGECDNKDLRDALLKAYIAGGEYGYQYALQHPHWIPVEERLPEEENLYIVSNGKETSVAYWVEDAWDSFGDVITHWMPLPKAPQGKEDEI